VKIPEPGQPLVTYDLYRGFLQVLVDTNTAGWVSNAIVFVGQTQDLAPATREGGGRIRPIHWWGDHVTTTAAHVAKQGDSQASPTLRRPA